MFRSDLLFRTCIEHLDTNFGYVPNRTVHLFLPTSVDFTDDYKEILVSEENDYFLIKKVSASALIEEAFLQMFFRKGSLVVITKVENEVDNFVGITESGKLILSLENNIADYLSLLREKIPHKKMQTHAVYVIQINSQDFAPGNRYYDSVVAELLKIDHIKFDVLLKWKPEGDICCGSIREYFESQGYECITYEPLSKETNFSVEIPELNFPDFTPRLAEGILEWFGFRICDIENSDLTDAYFKIMPFYDKHVMKRSCIFNCEGFYTFEDIQNLLKKVRNFFIKDPQMPYVALICGAYQHCYVDNEITKTVTSADRLVFMLISRQCNYYLFTLNL